MEKSEDDLKELAQRQSEMIGELLESQKKMVDDSLGYILDSNARQERFEKRLESSFEKFAKQENKNVWFMRILSALLLSVLGFFLFEVHNRFIVIENRLTELETKFEICVDCNKNGIQKFGGFTWNSYKGYDYGENHELNLGLNIDILTEQYRWKCGETEQIERSGRDANIEEVIKGYLEPHYLDGVKELICLGTASSEGRKQGEEIRAEDRMETLFNTIDKFLRNENIPIKGLNLGKYIEKDPSGKCSDKTLWQRRVVIIKVIEKAPNLDNEDYLKSLKRILLNTNQLEDEFPIDITKYSKFQDGSLAIRFGRK